MVNERLDILQFRGHTGPYLEPASGAASFNLLKMAREGLLLELRSALNEAKRLGVPARKPGVRVKSNGGFRAVNVAVIPLKSSPASKPGCFLVLFEEANSAPAPGETKQEKTSRAKTAESGRAVAALQQELAATKEYLQSVIDEHERTNEELQSANEEILSSNEELQSANEELETGKEELQSTNEELGTVNDELHTRNGELGQLNNDLINLLANAPVPIVMFARDLRIRRFTPSAEKVLNLIPSDVGRPFGDLRPNLIAPDLERLVGEVIETLAPKEFEAQDRDGRWYSLRLRPYKTLDNKIDGVVLALVEVDELKRSLAEAREARAYAEAIVETVREPLLVLDPALRVKTANHAFYEMFKTSKEATENRFVYSLGNNQWNIPRLRVLLEEILPKNTRFENFDMDAEFPGAGRKRLRLNARCLVDDTPATRLILLAMEERRS
jgi:two-component system CheB/CheR fusion protein